MSGFNPFPWLHLRFWEERICQFPTVCERRKNNLDFVAACACARAPGYCGKEGKELDCIITIMYSTFPWYPAGGEQTHNAPPPAKNIKTLVR